MKASIAVAVIEHASEIARIAADALNVSVEAECAHVRRVLGAGRTFVAIADGHVVGFISNFITHDEHGRARFELDLLGVAPAWQGRGIGARLIESSVNAARDSKAATIRALVRRDNLPMRRLCSRRGLQRSKVAYQLWVSQAGDSGGSSERSDRARIIAVDTLTYSGYWLEGALSQSTIDEARTMLLAHPERTVVGSVVPEQDRRAIDLLRANSFDRIGDYRWWTLSL